jgi:hypothetical protein
MAERQPVDDVCNLNSPTATASRWSMCKNLTSITSEFTPTGGAISANSCVDGLVWFVLAGALSARGRRERSLWPNG